MIDVEALDREFGRLKADYISFLEKLKESIAKSNGGQTDNMHIIGHLSEESKIQKRIQRQIDKVKKQDKSHMSYFFIIDKNNLDAHVYENLITKVGFRKTAHQYYIKKYTHGYGKVLISYDKYFSDYQYSFSFYYKLGDYYDEHSTMFENCKLI